MNIKKILFVLLLATGSTLALLAQPLPESLLQKRPSRHLLDHETPRPYRLKPNQARDVTFLQPEKVYYYYYPDFETPDYEISYSYDDQNTLKTLLWKPLKTGKTAAKEEYNRTLTIAGLDMADTVTYYSDAAMTKPTRRWYWNWKLYEASAIDSFYYEQAEQRWNETTNKWGNYSKYRMGFIDTIMWEVNRNIYYQGNGADMWLLSISYVDDPIFYDANGFVTGKIIDDYPTNNNIKHVYALNEDGSVRTDSTFVPQPEGYVLWSTNEYEWLEWHGYGDMTSNIIVLERDGLYYLHPWMQQRNKKTLTNSYAHPNGEKIFQGQEKTYWNTGPHYSHIDSVFVDTVTYTYENRYLATVRENRYDSYGNYTMYSSIAFEQPDATGYQAIRSWEMDKYRYVYTDYGYGIGCDSIVSWIVDLSTVVPQAFDSVLTRVEKVVRYVVNTPEYPQAAHALHIMPNPASDKVMVSATDVIQTLRIYDLAGKLHTSYTPKSDQTVFDVGMLPKGIYIVGAQLQSGNTQMGKLLVR
ncbi:MAG: T9SS type A sorting domain-containing protein [Lentimicrobiaceae bacterium]|jgi:hypothetical protein|nr:T9SS type A sorting domain-containing protein [Lentimicrobiaceae bacterium]